MYGVWLLGINISRGKYTSDDSELATYLDYFIAALTRFSIRQATFIGPTPPGVGV